MLPQLLSLPMPYATLSKTHFPSLFGHKNTHMLSQMRVLSSACPIMSYEQLAIGTRPDSEGEMSFLSCSADGERSDNGRSVEVTQITSQLLALRVTMKLMRKHRHDLRL